MSILTFGEIMLRLSPPGRKRFGQTPSLEMYFGGSEANTAIALAHWKHWVRYVTRLPGNFVGDACLMYLRSHGVDTSTVEREGDRLGTYFVEHGHDVRAMRVVYDRKHSAFSEWGRGDVPWAALMAQAEWLHWSGITPALADNLYQMTEEAVETAVAAGKTVSCDLNYRAALWQWGMSPREIMPRLLQHTHVVIANGASLTHMLGVDVPSIPLPDSQAAWSAWEQVAVSVAEAFPNVHTVAITLRGTRSGDEYLWSAVLWHRDSLYRAPVYRLAPVVDRVGAGDAFTAGLIHGLLAWPQAPERTLAFAAAAGAMKHTVPGDALLASEDEVETIARAYAVRSPYLI